MRTIVGTLTPEFLEEQSIAPLSIDNGTLLVGTWRDEVASDMVFQMESLFSARVKVISIDLKRGQDAIRALYDESGTSSYTPVVDTPPQVSEPSAFLPLVPEEAPRPDSASATVTEPLTIERVEAPANDSFPAIDATWPEAAAMPITSDVAPIASESALPPDYLAAPVPRVDNTWVADDDTDDDQTPAPGTLRALANEPSVVRLVSLIINEGIKQQASEIHFERQADSLRVRYKVGEVLRDALSPPRSMAPAVMGRLKNMAHLDLTDRPVPQGGTVRLAMAQGTLDMHVRVELSSQGEKLVLRLIRIEPAKRDLDMLGMSPADQARFETVVMQRRGLILVTGPAGSGKTTTLYAALRHRRRDGAKILTVEEPVAYHLDGVTQVPVNERAGVTFASALRVMLRQEPDVIFVGELRDAETADVAVQTALTGHLVLSTIAATDAVDGLIQLASLGVASYLVAGSVEAVVAQRMVRAVCPICATHVAASESDREALGIAHRFQMVHGVGCDACEGSGYLGTTVLFEIVVLDEPIRAAIASGADSADIRELARAARVTNLRDDGTRLVLKGLTTPEEVVRVTQGMSRQVVSRSGRVPPVTAQRK